jgi:hypothetical protein
MSTAYRLRLQNIDPGEAQVSDVSPPDLCSSILSFLASSL